MLVAHHNRLAALSVREFIEIFQRTVYPRFKSADNCRTAYLISGFKLFYKRFRQVFTFRKPRDTLVVKPAVELNCPELLLSERYDLVFELVLCK